MRNTTTSLDKSVVMIQMSSTVVRFAGQEHAIQAFDQQFYAIAQQVKWSRPDILEPHVLRLCGFHSLSTFIFALGKPGNSRTGHGSLRSGQMFYTSV
jgi:hypothetical protein